MKIASIEDCCAPLQEVLDRRQAERVAASLRVVADPARLQLLSLIAAQPGREACVCDLIEPLGLTQPTVSHHLRVLSEAGILEREKRGKWAYYRVVPSTLRDLRSVFEDGDVAAGTSR